MYTRMLIVMYSTWKWLKGFTNRQSVLLQIGVFMNMCTRREIMFLWRFKLTRSQIFFWTFSYDCIISENFNENGYLYVVISYTKWTYFTSETWFWDETIFWQTYCSERARTSRTLKIGILIFGEKYTSTVFESRAWPPKTAQTFWRFISLSV